jgi:hypothetical protein
MSTAFWVVSPLNPKFRMNILPTSSRSKIKSSKKPLEVVGQPKKAAIWCFETSGCIRTRGVNSCYCWQEQNEMLLCCSYSCLCVSTKQISGLLHV